jgi:hypothetical protein
MAKLEATKTIEARKMNKRNRQTLSEMPVTIPYGAILDEVVENRDMMEFSYLGDLYCCKSEVLRTASQSLDHSQPVISPSGNSSVQATPAAATFIWEKVNSGSIPTLRAKVQGGWFVAVGDSRSVTFYPDAGHTWDGTTI